MGIHDGHREKMRKRFCETGLEGFADHEALELLLYYAIPRRDTNGLAHRLMLRYGSLAALLQAPVEDLQRVEGIGESAAVFLKLVPAFVYKAQRSAAGASSIRMKRIAGIASVASFMPMALGSAASVISNALRTTAEKRRR